MKNAILLGTFACGLLQPFCAVALDAPTPYEQDFIITAYYSPEPDQCCYVKGSFAADVILNGEGTHGADGTEVMPGMAAAPKSYAFGTSIELPGLGVVEVHDRGGAINELPNGAHRLDLWVGKGEEGLARALAFGVRRVRGTVYPLGTTQPKMTLALNSLSAPLDSIRPFASKEPTLLSLAVEMGDRSLSVRFLQETLVRMGYFSATPNGVFGPETQKSLVAFQNDYRLGDEPSDHLSVRSAAVISVLAKRGSADPAWLASDLSSKTVPEVKRALRLLGFYNGRTGPVVNEAFTEAVLSFQLSTGIIESATSVGAGTLGPKTRKTLKREWLSRIVFPQADKLIFAHKIREMVAERDLLVEDFIGTGDKGEQVTRLQDFLADAGYLARKKVTGAFGSETETALVAYQMKKGIVTSKKDRGAGFAGPATLSQISKDRERELTLFVRANGWNAL